MTGGMTNVNRLSMKPTGLPMSVGVFMEEEKFFWGFTGMTELKS
jgi:hypothetical protein